jgi:hypothetical protein
MKPYQGFVPLETQISKILKPVLVKKKDHFLLMKNLNKNWQKIIGEKCWQFCAPKKIQFADGKKFGKKSHGTLYIKAYNSAMAFYLEANCNQIVENIASYYGYKIIEQIKIIQEPKNILTNNNQEKIEQKISPEKQNLITKKLDNIKDLELKNILQKLGTSILK